MAIDYSSVILIGTGFIFGIAVYFLFSSIFKRKKKYDLHNIKKLVYETGTHQREAYKGIQELEKLFKEMENAQR